MRHSVVGAILGACVFFESLPAQVPGKVDFGRDVQPLLREHCVSCHGPSQQMNGLRLDRRRDAMRGGTIPGVIVPGNSAGSRLYLKLIGNQYGPQMPPTGPLSAEEINIFKAWLDQGAEWPDALSGETPAAPPDPQAARLMAALRAGDRQAFTRSLREDPKVVNRKGPGGSTPLMYAALYGDSDSVRRLLEGGADPNLRNEAGVTALMWATADPEKSRLLLERGADPNARSDDARTPLMIAAGRFGSTDVVKLLLDRGANPSVKAHSLFGEMTPLNAAASVGNEAVLRMLIRRGADPKKAGFLPLLLAVRANCARCVDLLIESVDEKGLTMATLFLAPPLADAHKLTTFLDRGVDIHAKDSAGRTLLMLAASSDALPVQAVKTLIDRGVDIHAKNSKGQTALDFAKQRGQTPVVDLLLRAGAKEMTGSTESTPTPKPANSVRAALQRSIPLLQRADAIFLQKSGCVSCHNNTLTAMTVATARKHKLPVDEESARKQRTTIGSYLHTWRERVLQGIGIPGDADTVSYILLGLAAENYPADAATDAMAYYLKSQQWPDGRWQILAHRPPLESNDIQVTAASLRSLQVYAPQAQQSEYEKAVQRAAAWLMKAQPKTTEEKAFQLLGLRWSRASAKNEIVRRTVRELLAEQRPDGGWSQIPSLSSDAYATGEALVALKEAGVQVTEPAYQRGVQFLLNTQLEDGSWYVKSRAIAFQPFFESGFPHGHDQWISAAASNWAAMALAFAAR